MLSPNDVFTPGRLPTAKTNVYARRGVVEDDYRKALKRGLIPLVYGGYGVGKTSMARVCAQIEELQGRLVFIENVGGKSVSDIQSQCLEHMGYHIEKTQKFSSSSTHNSNMEAGGTFAVFRAVFKKSKQNGQTTETIRELAVTSPTDARILRLCESHGILLIIDELHRANNAFLDDLTLLLKSYANSNCQQFKISLLGTSADASRLVRHDPGIDRLLQELYLPGLSHSEARYIIERGMAQLDIDIPPIIVDQTIDISSGSPSVLQYLSLEMSELADDRSPRRVFPEDLHYALTEYVDKRAARLNTLYRTATETVGAKRYRTQILHAMAELEDDFVTMEQLRAVVSANLGESVKSNNLAKPLKELKSAKYGPVLRDVKRLDNQGSIGNLTMFADPAMKAFLRVKIFSERDVQRPLRILFLAANPAVGSRLSLDSELHEIERNLRADRLRDSFQLISNWVITPSDLQEALLRHQPDILHFLGHDEHPDGQLVLPTQEGTPTRVTESALRAMFSVFQDSLRLVVLDSCFSEDQALALASSIDFVVGISQEIDKSQAILFTASFYRALGFGVSIRDSFTLGVNSLQVDTGAIDAEEIEYDSRPRLLVRSGADPNDTLARNPFEVSRGKEPSV